MKAQSLGPGVIKESQYRREKSYFSKFTCYFCLDTGRISDVHSALGPIGTDFVQICTQCCKVYTCLYYGEKIDIAKDFGGGMDNDDMMAIIMEITDILTEPDYKLPPLPEDNYDLPLNHYQ